MTASPFNLGLSEGRVKRVSQAAFDSGFNDLSHFGRAFKKRYGLLPLSLLRNDPLRE
jgi:AraC-like DNA-binding protein